MERRVRVFVSGHVQGVWFRDATRREAEPLRLKGWVQNLPDGRVEAVFEGTPYAVDRLVAWCHDGPPQASVRHVEVIEEEPQGEAPFEVRR